MEASTEVKQGAAGMSRKGKHKPPPPKHYGSNGARIEARHAGMVERLEKLIDARGTNVRTLAAEAGLGATYIYDIMIGKNRKPSAEHLTSIAKVLGTTLEYIMGTGENNSGIKAIGQGMFAMPITGMIEAGAYRVDERVKRQPMLEAARNADYPNARHFALEIRDDSFSGAAEGGMTRGGFVLCVDAANAKLVVETGGIYVIRRTLDHGSSWETILRRAKVFRDHCELRAEGPGKLAPISIKGVLGTNPAKEVYAQGLVYGTLHLFKR